MQRKIRHEAGIVKVHRLFMKLKHSDLSVKKTMANAS